ncbi:hypothetical protein EHJ07_00715, partial [Cronobacter muytjensii]|nr:hypothetical protein [Cronobacter muytjensii]
HFVLPQGGDAANPREHTKVCDWGERGKPTPRQDERRRVSPEEARRPGSVCKEPVLRPHVMGSDAEVARRLATFAIDCRG